MSKIEELGVAVSVGLCNWWMIAQGCLPEGEAKKSLEVIVGQAREIGFEHQRQWAEREAKGQK